MADRVIVTKRPADHSGDHQLVQHDGLEIDIGAGIATSDVELVGRKEILILQVDLDTEKEIVRKVRRGRELRGHSVITVDHKSTDESVEKDYPTTDKGADLAIAVAVEPVFPEEILSLLGDLNPKFEIVQEIRLFLT